MRRGIIFSALLVSVVLSTHTLAQSINAELPANLQNDYETLIREFRCLVCQNQSIADSNSEFAIDLRQRIVTMLEEGKSPKEIHTVLMERYGAYIQYEPPLHTSTVLLWAFPFLFLLLGAWILWRQLRAPSEGSGKRSGD